MPKDERLVAVTVNIPRAMVKQIDAIAAQQLTTRSQLIRTATNDILKRLSKRSADNGIAA